MKSLFSQILRYAEVLIVTALLFLSCQKLEEYPCAGFVTPRNSLHNQCSLIFALPRGDYLIHLLVRVPEEFSIEKDVKVELHCNLKMQGEDDETFLIPLILSNEELSKREVWRRKSISEGTLWHRMPSHAGRSSDGERFILWPLHGLDVLSDYASGQLSIKLIGDEQLPAELDPWEFRVDPYNGK